jgi:hypothetical protein
MNFAFEDRRSSTFGFLFLITKEKAFSLGLHQLQMYIIYTSQQSRKIQEKRKGISV